jgi:hypothetical protein
MNGFLKSLIGLCLFFTLTGCIGEDYDVGVPTAHLNLDILSVQLTEANISWDKASEDVQQKIEDIEKFASSLDEIKVFSNQKASLDFKENEENGGDIWTDLKITVSLLKDDQRIELPLDNSREFQFPTNKGSYVLEVEFINSAGSAQYLGNVLIDLKSKDKDKLTWDLKGDKPDPVTPYSVTIGYPNIKLYAKNTGAQSFRVEVKHNSKNTVIFNATVAEGTTVDLLNNNSMPLVPSGPYTVTIYGGSGLPKGQILLESSDTWWP